MSSLKDQKQLSTKLHALLTKQEQACAFRKLNEAQKDFIDFSSNDYLGLAHSGDLKQRYIKKLLNYQDAQLGSTASRLVTGDHSALRETEQLISTFHNAASATIFSSGYLANLALLSSLPERKDSIFYDQYIHASSRDGIKLSKAKSFPFKHNSIESLKDALNKHATGTPFIVTESIFSMDGDSPDKEELISVARQFNAIIIVDEAHALGVLGEQGKGLWVNCPENVIRVLAFGKALGCSGAAILGACKLQQFLTNFARSFIYTTAPSIPQVLHIQAAYEQLMQSELEIKKISELRSFWNQNTEDKPSVLSVQAAIGGIMIPGNTQLLSVSDRLNKAEFQLYPMRYPTVAKGKERIRIVLHSFNTEDQISKLLTIVQENSIIEKRITR